MATRDEIVDQIAGFALFADLSTPAARADRPHVRGGGLPRGRRASCARACPGRRSTSSSTARRPSSSTAQQRATLARGDFFGEVSILLGEPPGADIVATRPLRTLVLAGPRSEAFLLDNPPRDVPDAPGAGAPPAEREPVAELSGRPTGDPRPFPPGDYPVVVVGSGAGRDPGLVLAAPARDRPCRHLGRPGARAGCSGAGRSSSACCPGRSRTRRSSAARRAYERYDWNSLLADEPEHRALMPELMDGTSYFPSRPEMEREPRDLRRADRDRDPLRLPLDGDPPRGRPTGDRFVLETTDGEYRAEVLDLRRRRRRAVHAADARHRARRPLRRHAAGRDLRRPAGLHHRQAELRLRARHRPPASGRARSSSSRRRRPSCRSTRTRWSASGRATSSRSRITSSAAACRSSTPRSSGIERRERRRLRRPRPADRRRRGARDRGRRGDRGDRASSRRSSTCRTSASRRSARPGCRPRRRTGRARPCPGSTSPARSGRARPGLKKHGLPANSGAVHGPATTRGSWPGTSPGRASATAPERPRSPPTSSLDDRSASWRRAPELWHQRAYLARVDLARPGGGLARRGHRAARRVRRRDRRRRHGRRARADARGGRDRRDLPGHLPPPRRQVEERVIEPDPLLRFDTPATGAGRARSSHEAATGRACSSSPPAANRRPRLVVDG